MKQTRMCKSFGESHRMCQERAAIISFSVNHLGCKMQINRANIKMFILS